MTDPSLAVLALGIGLVVAAVKSAGLPGRFAPLLVIALSVALAFAPAQIVSALSIAALIASAAWGGHHFVVKPALAGMSNDPEPDSTASSTT